MRSPTARDAAEGLADQIERRMKAASLLGGAQLREAMMDLGRLVYVESTPIITALRSAGTEGGETQGVGTPCPKHPRGGPVEARPRGGAKILAGLADILAYAQGDTDRATLHTFVVRDGVAAEVKTPSGEPTRNAFRVGRRVPENVYREGRPWLSAGSPERAARLVTTCAASGTKAAQIDHAVRAFHADLDTILAGWAPGTRTTDGGEA